MLLVTGATGNVGAAVLRELIARGVPVRALVRPGTGQSLPDGCEVAEGDLGSVEDVVSAARDVTALFMLSGYAGLDDSLEELEKAGLRRVVLMSSSAAPSGDLTNAVAAYHLHSEARLAATGLEWTYLRSYALMTNVFRWTPQLRDGDLVRQPFADVPIAMIDPADLARVAAACLTEEGHAGRAYPLSGGRALFPAEQAAAVGRALGRSIEFQAVPNDVAREEMAKTTPPQYVDAFFRFYEAGELDETTVVDTVERVTGRPPNTLDTFLDDNLDRLRASVA